MFLLFFRLSQHLPGMSDKNILMDFEKNILDFIQSIAKKGSREQNQVRTSSTK